MNAIVQQQTAGAVYRLPVARIAVDDRLRAIDPDWAESLKDSILANRRLGQSGLIHPIEVRTQGNGWRLVAGAHRLEAVRRIGDTEVDAVVREFSDLEARLREIDENLVDRGLSPFDRATFLAERKRLMEELYPETKRGRKGALARWHDATGNLPVAFSEEAARRTGLHVDHIRKIIRTFERLSPATRGRIRGTWIADNESQIRALTKAGPELQAKLLDVLLRPENPARNVAAALDEVEGRRKPTVDPEEQAFLRFVGAWARIATSTALKKRAIAHLREVGVVIEAPAKAAAKPARKAAAKEAA